MEKCDLDKCSLSDDIGEIKEAQKTLSESHIEMNTTQRLFIQKVDTYMEHGKEEHDILFARTRGTINWTHLLMALAGVSTLMGIIWGAIKMSGGA